MEGVHLKKSLLLVHPAAGIFYSSSVFEGQHDKAGQKKAGDNRKCAINMQRAVTPCIYTRHLLLPVDLCDLSHLYGY